MPKITLGSLSSDFVKIVLSGAKSGAAAHKIIIRPVEIKGVRQIQVEEFVGPQAFHKNMDIAAAEKYLGRVSKNFANVNITRGTANLSHDREKDYAFKDGVVIPPLVRLGIMDESGRVFKSKMDKFIQINNFISILGDAVRDIKTDGRLTIVDFCCGKSYLTFVVQYYFEHILNRPVHITGIDSKSDVIKNCGDIKRELVCDNLDLVADDINNFQPAGKIDIALSLHACDIATDAVLKKAVALGATVILAVPCCHKQLAKQIRPSGQNSELDFILKYGLLRERFAAILTDALRAEWLAANGYKVDVLEFVDFDNSPKNVMIRAIRTGKKSNADISKIAKEFNVQPEILKEG